MLVMFVSIDVQELTGIFSGAGQNSLGSFKGNSIPREAARRAAQSCERQFSNLSTQNFKQEMIQTFLNNCIRQRIKDLYALSAVARGMGLEVSQVSVEQAVWEEAQQYARQDEAQNRDDDDKLSAGDYYERLVASESIDIRKLWGDLFQLQIEMLDKFPYPQDLIKAQEQSELITMDLRFIRYNNSDLLRLLDKSITISDDKVRERYDQEQVKLPADKKKPYTTEKQRVRNKLLSELKQKSLTEIKTKLSGVGSRFELEKIAQITGVKPSVAGGENLSNLQTVKTGEGNLTANLALPGFLSRLGTGKGKLVVGPLQDDKYTVYIEATNFKIPRDQGQAKADKEAERKNKARATQEGGNLAQRLIRIIGEEEANRSGFFLKNLSAPRQR